MVLAKSKNSVGLGNSLMNDRFGKGKGADRKKVSHNAAAIQRKGTDGETYITNPSEEASWVKMRSITEQAALDEFLSTAELAGTDFTAEKMNNVKIIHQDQKNPYLLSAADERNAIRKHQKNRARLTVPRRPKWNEKTTRHELDAMERENFLEWRRGLAELQEREAWADYFEEHNISYKFFSAALAKEINEANEQNGSEGSEEEDEEEDEDEDEVALAERTRKARIEDSEEDSEEGSSAEEVEDEDDSDDDDGGGLPLPQEPGPKRTEIITVGELEALFMSAAPPRDPNDERSKDVTTIGLVGYPNVAGLVAQRVPLHFLEAVYGIKIPIRPLEEGGTGTPTASEILRAYARARGFATTGLGQPDESRAARYVLKDYVNGKLLFCHPPPRDPPFTDTQERTDYELAFNEGLYDMAHLPARRKEAMLREHAAALAGNGESVDGINDDFDLKSDITTSQSSATAPGLIQGARSKKLDKGFFGPGGSGSAGHLKMPFSYKYTEVGKEAGKVKEITGRKQRTLIALEKNIDVSEVRGPGKKHFKGNRKVKTRQKGNSFLADDE
ncbi:nucleolar GTP-binding protein 2 [Arthroderma uncinatum]|uniref:nucleolar GTP-binding protein 2 n=1 Tax=Arthroderma uncinatum TaxID=74035 RepID=UPI00144A8317|nr:nucleolar GTP-binding protein 2 [Arthroderma uncinatum]KAF3482413.1 nucleolar GTP-binding protein 2 [Arthroderma uncinatum]